MAANHSGSERRIGSMFWRLVIRALRLRMQRVSVVFAALMVGAAIVTAMSAVYFDINAKMSQELRTFGANFLLVRRTAAPWRKAAFSRFSTTPRRG